MLSTATKAAAMTAMLASSALANPTNANTSFAKPPQFVMFAFDGSKSNPMWEETRAYAKNVTAQGKDLKFTYFINTVYLIHHKNRKMHVPEWNRAIYQAPQLPAGVSAISYGCSGVAGDCGNEDVQRRAQNMSKAFLEGHEIASHAVGHFDANGGRAAGTTYKRWSLDDWRSEHNQFFSLLFNALRVQNIKPFDFGPSGMAFKRSNIIGFRAPQLGIGDGFNEALAENKFKYDTSRVNAATYWPEKLVSSKAWNFPLATIPVYRPKGNTFEAFSKTLAMDYNFCVVQTTHATGKATGECKTIEGKATQFRDEMYASYMQYFLRLYTGNRAPIQIGHHFSKWNNSAYWDAMKMFAESVCAIPDVKCVTYEEYTKWIEGLTPAALKFYRAYKGNWSGKPKSLANYPIVSEGVRRQAHLTLDGDRFKALLPAGLRAQGMTAQLEINGQPLRGESVSLNQALSSLSHGESEALMTVKVVDARGRLVHQTNQILRDAGYSTVRLDKVPAESAFLKGDMAGAHKE